jgi:hypothetical protein
MNGSARGERIDWKPVLIVAGQITLRTRGG